MILRLILSGLMTAAALPQIALSCGMSLHIYTAELAMERVTDPSLKAFLKDNQSSTLNGSFFPDSGYNLGQDKRYGEFAHWETFHNGYLDLIADRCSWPLKGECRKVFAHYLGSVAHVATDVNFDRYFVTQVAQISFNNNVSDAQAYTDAGLDFLAMFDQGRAYKLPRPYLPLSFVAPIIGEEFPHVASGDIDIATNLSRLAILAQPAGSVFTYLYYKYRSPWAAAHYMTARGGIYDSAQIVAKFWQLIWQRLSDSPGFMDLPQMAHSGGWPQISLRFD